MCKYKKCVIIILTCQGFGVADFLLCIDNSVSNSKSFIADTCDSGRKQSPPIKQRKLIEVKDNL